MVTAHLKKSCALDASSRVSESREGHPTFHDDLFHRCNEDSDFGLEREV